MPSISKLALVLLLASGAFAAPSISGNLTATVSTGDTNVNLNVNANIDTSRWRDIKKSLTVIEGEAGRRVAIRAKSLNQSVQYFGEFHLSTAGIPNTGARFFMRDQDSISAFGLRVGLIQLAEVNAGKNIDVANSNNTIKFAGSTRFWSPIQVTNVPNSNNVVIKKLSTTFTNATGLGTNVSVTVDAYLASEKVTINNVTYLPRSLKYGLLIENFPFQYADSQLAIVKGVMFKSVDKDDFTPNDQSMAIAGAKGRFNWTSSVNYDGQNMEIKADTTVYTNATLPVVAFVQDDVSRVDVSEAAKFVVFRTKQGNYSRIEWDPEVAVDEEKIASSAATVAASFGLSVFVAFCTLFVNLF